MTEAVWRQMDRNHPVFISGPETVNGQREGVDIDTRFDAFFLLLPVRNSAGDIRDYSFSDSNTAGERFLGKSRSEFIGKLISGILPDGFCGVSFPQLLLTTQTSIPIEEVRQVQTGEVCIFRIQVVPAGDGLTVAISDVTAIKRAQDVSADNGHFIEKLTGALPEFIYVLNADESGVTFRSRDFMSQLGYPVDVAGTGLLSLPSLIHPQDQVPFYHHTQDALSGRDDEVFEVTCRIATAKGEWRWFQIRTTVYQRYDGLRPTQLLRTIRDVSSQLQNEIELRDIVKQLRVTQLELRERQSQLQQLNQQLASLATTDGLTSLYNFRAFHEKLAEETRRAKRYLQPLAVVMADIDNFKLYNDKFGHPAGDERLRYFAKLLQEGSRNSDFIARYGGEEFAMILSNTSAAGAAAYAQGIIDRLRDDPASKGITASFGCTELKVTDQSKDDLVRRADECLYEAKRQGKNRFVMSQGDPETLQTAS